MKRLPRSVAIAFVSCSIAACTSHLEPTSPPDLSTGSKAQRLESKLEPRPYRHYLVTRSKDGVKVQLRAFEGLVMLPDVAKALDETKSLTKDDHGNLHTGWRQEGFSTRSIITDAKRISTNVLTIGEDGSVSSTLDIDGDRVVDVADILTAQGTRHVFVTESLGLGFFNAWVHGWNPLCSDAKNAGLKDPSMLAAFGCGADDGTSDGSTSASPGGPLGAFGTRGSLDPLDAMCAGHSSGRKGFQAPVLAHGGHGYGSRIRHWGFDTNIPNSDGGGQYVVHEYVYSDAEGNHVSTYRTRVDYGTDGSTTTTNERVDHEGRGRRTVTERRADGTTTTREEEIEAELDDRGFIKETDPPGAADTRGTGDSGGDGEDAETTDPKLETPSPGPSGDGSDWESALAEFCKRRAEAKEYQSGAETATSTDPRDTEMDCDDPVTNPDPNATASSSGDPRECGVPQAEQTDVDGALGSGSPATTCGPYAQPGADGTCGPGRTIDQLRGGAGWIGQADIAGFEICNPIVCNPNL